MGPIRTSRAHTKLEPALAHETGSSKNFETIDGLLRGWQYKKHYTAPVAPEFAREADVRIRHPDDPRPLPLQLRDLECIKALGQGEYGQVLMVRTARATHPLDRPGSHFAMKVLRKKHIRFMDHKHPNKKNVERARLVELPWNPFVTGVVQAFHDDKNLYLMSELIPCGTLRSIIQKRAPLGAVTAAFYFANIVSGLAFLQTYEIVHRDLKPENILVGADGYLCITDFGTAAKEFEENDWLLIGTPTYMAPEIFSAAEQSTRTFGAVDWWSAGCVLYEMTTRKMPFYGRSQGATFKKALTGNPEWPLTLRVGRNLKSLITGLLTVDASKRLGIGGAYDAMTHPWLKHIDWTHVRHRKYLAPYVPKEPHLDELWHIQGLPDQRRMPGLKIVPTPSHLAHDNRFPEKSVI